MYQATGASTLLNIYLILNKATISENMKIADLGCGGNGSFVFSSSALVGKRGKVFAVDILKTILERIKRKAKQENLENIESIWSDLETFGATKIESSSLDVTLLVNTLHQSRKRTEIIREAIRMLKKGGKIVIVEWKKVALPFGPPPEARVDNEALVKILEHLGMDIETEFQAGQYHYGIVAVKH